jgi:hypothetical protein
VKCHGAEGTDAETNASDVEASPESHRDSRPKEAACDGGRRLQILAAGRLTKHPSPRTNRWQSFAPKACNACSQCNASYFSIETAIGKELRLQRVRDGGRLIDCAVLVAVGVASDGRRRVLGVSVAVLRHGFETTCCAYSGGQG